MSTTSEAGASFQSIADASETCCSYVLDAIVGFIPPQTLAGSSFAITIEVVESYTLIRYRGAPAADGPRYKALGNAMCVNDVRWLLERIELFETMAIKTAKGT